MKILFFAALFVGLAFQNCLAQDFEEAENWIGEIEGYQHPYLIHRLIRFTKDDVVKAKEKLNSTKSADNRDEWEGAFGRYGELSEIRLFWNTDIGFIDYYIFTCAIELRNLNYGRVSDSPDSVRFISEKPVNAAKKVSVPTGSNFIKVKVGEKHFLVPENELADFCESAAGLSLDENSAEPNYWWKLSDFKKSNFGLPILPRKYKNFLRFPIKTRIAKIGKRESFQFKNDKGILENDYVNYYFTSDAGKNDGVKKGMKFYIPEMQEWAEVASVYLENSRMFIQRRFGDGEKELCSDDNYKEHECGNLAVGMTAQTQNNHL